MLNTSQAAGGGERLSGKAMFRDWIVDSGASHHMTGTINLLSDIYPIDPCPVGLPNGETAYAVKEGSLFLGDTNCLHHVLFVPNINCTMLSVSKLLSDLSCTVTFADHLCVI